MEDIIRTTAGPGAEMQRVFQITSNGGVNTGSAGVNALHSTATGSTFYITDIFVTSDYVNTSTQLIQFEISGGVIIFEAYVSNTCPIEFAGIESQPQSPSNNVLSIKWPAAAGHLTYFVAGYEQ